MFGIETADGNLEVLDSDFFYNILKEYRIAIYGTGFVAMKFYNALLMQGLSEKVECFIVTRKEDALEYIDGREVKSVHEYENIGDIFICLAVHEVGKREIEEILKAKDISNYIWIYPYLFELALGKPLQRGVVIPTDRIVQQCHDYRIAVRYLAIENYFGKNNYGYSIYIKAQALRCEKGTAEKRLKAFCNLIQSWEKHGYKLDSNIFIDDKYQLIDGAHRITLAWYFQLKEVVCNIFRSTEMCFKWLGSEALLTKRIVLNADFTKEELAVIECAYRKVRGEMRR